MRFIIFLFFAVMITIGGALPTPKGSKLYERMVPPIKGERKAKEAKAIEDAKPSNIKVS